METRKMETLTDFQTRRMFYKKKTSYKRRAILFIWAAFIAYFSLVSEEVEGQGLTGHNFMMTSNLRSVKMNDTEFNPDFSDAIEDLIEGINCTAPAIADFPRDLFTPSQRSQGAIVLHFLASLYLFYCVALVCDDFFVPSIECICEDLHLPSDVGGATFMAIATSAPELFTNVVGTFITEGDIGIGTIVGSAVFNILAVGACCGLAANRSLDLEWFPLTRDCLFYCISVVLLIVVQLNRRVHWYEALGLVLFYFVYIGVMCKNSMFKDAAENFVNGIIHRKKRDEFNKNSLSIRGIAPQITTETTSLLDEKLTKSSAAVAGANYDAIFTFPISKIPSSPSSTSCDQVENGVSSPLENSDTRGYSEEGEADENDDDDYSRSNDSKKRLSVEEYDELLISQALKKSVAHAKEEEEEGGLFILPRGASIIEWSEWIFGWPIRFCFMITIPDCRQQRARKWYPLTFVMCMLWIGGLSYFVSWMMTVIGHTLRIPDSVMGLTFIAAGTSVPEAVSSIIVARQGLGSMGISNSIGSNTFDILICLGLPWLIRTSIIATDEVNYIQINSNGFGYTTIMLMVSLFFLYILLASNRFVLDRKVGFISLLMYAVFLVVATLMELNVFFPGVNLPSCATDF